MAMTQEEPPTPPGDQLRARREELSLTQDALARQVGVNVAAISRAETGKSHIQVSKRAAWEGALRLQPGSITRAYGGGTIEPANSAPDAPYADLTDRYERAIWEMHRLPEDDRRTLIDILRSARHINEEVNNRRVG